MFKSLFPPLVEVTPDWTIFFILIYLYNIYGLDLCSLFQNRRTAAFSFTYGCTSAGPRPESSGKQLLQWATHMVAMVSSSCSGTMMQAFIRTPEDTHKFSLTILAQIKLVLHSSETIHAKTTLEIILLGCQSLFVYCLIFLEHKFLCGWRHVLPALHLIFTFWTWARHTLCVCVTPATISQIFQPLFNHQTSALLLDLVCFFCVRLLMQLPFQQRRSPGLLIISN